MFLNITDTGQFCASIASHQGMNDFCVKHIKQWNSNQRHTLKKQYWMCFIHNMNCACVVLCHNCRPQQKPWSFFASPNMFSFHIFASFVLRVKVLVTNGPLDCLTSTWGLTSTCPVWRRITTEMLGDKKHVVVMKKTKSTITVYFKNTDVRKKQGEWVSARYPLLETGPSFLRGHMNQAKV